MPTTPAKHDIRHERHARAEIEVDASRLAWNLAERNPASLPATTIESLRDLRRVLTAFLPADPKAARARAVSRWREQNRDRVREYNREAQRRHRERHRAAQQP